MLGPFFTTDAADVEQMGSIVSKEKVAESGNPMIVKGRVLNLNVSGA